MQFIDKLKPPTDSKDVYVYLKNKYFILKKFYVAKSQQFVSIFHSIFTKKKFHILRIILLIWQDYFLIGHLHR